MKRILQELFEEHREDIKGGISLVVTILFLLGVVCLANYIIK
jgi:hypothetical protein